MGCVCLQVPKKVGGGTQGSLSSAAAGPKPAAARRPVIRM